MLFSSIMLISSLLGASVASYAPSVHKRALATTNIGVYSILGQGTVNSGQCTNDQALATAQVQLAALNIVNVCACVDVLSLNDPSVTQCGSCGSLGQKICNNGCACSCTDNAVKDADGTCNTCATGYHISADGTRCVADPVCPDHSASICSEGTCICVCNTGYMAVAGSTPLVCVLSGSPNARLVKKRTSARSGQCPSEELTCPLASGGYECVDSSSLENCGVCGNDCNQQPGAFSVGCNNGQCHIFSCNLGYDLVEGECVSQVE